MSIESRGEIEYKPAIVRAGDELTTKT